MTRVKFEGQIAIVTGTSPNIGAGIARGLADEGAQVVCVDVCPTTPRSAPLGSGAAAAPGHITCEVTDDAQAGAMVAQVPDSYGGVDVLVDNAGIRPRNSTPRPATRGAPSPWPGVCAG